MSIVLMLTGGILGMLYTLWVAYLAVMTLARARDADRLPKWALWLGQPLLWFGYLFDFIVNVFILSWILMEIPREVTVTARLSRHIKTSDGYRKMIATWICKNLLDFADPNGCHCR